MTQQKNDILDINMSPDGGQLEIDWFIPLADRTRSRPGHDVDIVSLNDCEGSMRLVVYFGDPVDERDLGWEDKRDKPLYPEGPKSLLRAAFEKGILHDEEQAGMFGHDGKSVRFRELTHEDTANLINLLVKDFKVPAEPMRALLRAAEITYKPTI